MSGRDAGRAAGRELSLLAGGLALALGAFFLATSSRTPGRAPELRPETPRPLLGARPASELGDAATEHLRVEAAPAHGSDAASASLRPAQPPGTPEAPARERDRTAELVALGRADPAALDRLAAERLWSDAAEVEKVALLSALFEVGTPRCGELVVAALQSLPDEDGARLSLPDCGVRMLSERALLQPRARAILRDATFGGSRAMPSRLRSRAAARLAQLADGEDLRALTLALERERDPLVVQSALHELRANPHAADAVALLGALVPPAADEPEGATPR